MIKDIINYTELSLSNSQESKISNLIFNSKVNMSKISPKILMAVTGVSIFVMLVSMGLAGYYLTKKDDKKSDKKDQKAEVTQIVTTTPSQTATNTPSVSVTPSTSTTTTPSVTATPVVPKKQHAVKLIAVGGSEKSYVVSFTSDNAVLGYAKDDDRKVYNYRSVILTTSDFKMNMKILAYPDGIGFEDDTYYKINNIVKIGSYKIGKTTKTINRVYNVTLGVYQYVSSDSIENNEIAEMPTSIMVNSNDGQSIGFNITCSKDSNLTKCDNLVKTLSIK